MEHMFTARDWNKRTERGAAARIVFVAASHSVHKTQSAVDGHTAFSSDHFLVYAEFSDPFLLVIREEAMKTSLLDWCPTVSLVEASACEFWKWDEWTTCKKLHAVAVEHKEPTPNRDCDDLELTSLIEEARKAPPESRRKFSKSIWRLRRTLRRSQNNARLAAACTAGRAPNQEAISHHIIGKRIMGDTDPAEAISLLCGAVFELNGEDLENTILHRANVGGKVVGSPIVDVSLILTLRKSSWLPVRTCGLLRSRPPAVECKVILQVRITELHLEHDNGSFAKKIVQVQDVLVQNVGNTFEVECLFLFRHAEEDGEALQISRLVRAQQRGVGPSRRSHRWSFAAVW